jgi:acyl-CoA synthetase (AMP-forming)/AMP-acid ligase II
LIRRRITLGELLTHQASEYPDRTFASFLDEGVSQVQESVVFGIAGELGDQDVAAVILRHEGQSICEEDLRVYCENEMARWMIPRVWKVVDDIPRTATGKPVKAALRALLEQ